MKVYIAGKITGSKDYKQNFGAAAAALEAEKRLQLASPEMVLFRQQFDAVQEAAGKLISLRRKIAQESAENGEKLKRALLALGEHIREEAEA